MTDEKTLWSAIQSRPNDTSLVLAYADCLEEMGRSADGNRWRKKTARKKRFFVGNGLGLGYGDGYGYGYGDGFGDGDGDKQKIRKDDIVIDKQMLIWAGLSFAWVGMVEEVTPEGYRLSNAGMLCRTGGTAWMHLAAGEGRDGMTFRQSKAENGELFIGDFISGAIEWLGELPGRDVG